jgi:hydroxyethylthiazole kinase-like uncharacterized protein yjeF
MRRVTPDCAWPLFDVPATRRIEHAAAAQLASHALMQRAGLAVARLALAIAPHTDTAWIVCGPGNNGGDGLEAAAHLQRWGKRPVVTWLGDETTASTGTLTSLRNARQAGVVFAGQAPQHCQLGIDALLGIGTNRPLDAAMAAWADKMSTCPTLLAVDLPSGLNANTGQGSAAQASHTLSLLTLKPGLFTAGGRDACGQVWLDDLGVAASEEPGSWLGGPPVLAERAHDSHKGSYGDVAVIGGASGMTGAALLAASAALHAGAGRVLVSLLDGSAMAVDVGQPELMFRPWDSLELAAVHVACGCGGGDAIRTALPKILSTARSLVLDADALNAVGADSQLQSLLQARSRRGAPTVLTPHPLEAARLLGSTAAQVQADRVAAAREMARRFGCTVLLKGSGSVVAAPGQLPLINPTGNARLATAGTGDVLAGMVAARLAAGMPAFTAAAAAAYTHGLAADRWPVDRALTAFELAHAG